MKLLQLQKRTMAIAGVVLTGYLIFHVVSNLSFFASPAFEQFYAFYNQPWVRWPILAVVILSLLVHVRAAIVIRIKNSKTRQVGYQKHDKLHIPAPLVTLSIVLLFAFIVFHIIQSLLIDTSQVYTQVSAWFSSTWITLIYLAGVFILMMHLSHSLINVMQTLAITSKMYKGLIWTGIALLTLGFASIPLYVWLMTHG